MDFKPGDRVVLLPGTSAECGGTVVAITLIGLVRVRNDQSGKIYGYEPEQLERLLKRKGES